MPNKNYNITGVDDMEYIERYGLDPALAYTPKINDAILKAERDVNYQAYIDDGMTEAQARSRSQDDHNLARQNVKKNLAKRKA